MKASEANLLDFLRKPNQFAIPIFQRTYSWTSKQCAVLWDDILKASMSDDVPTHFIGSIVYIEGGLSQVTKRSPLLVIDGQQRLTTMTLIIEALARQLGDTEPVDGFSANKLRNRYLLDPDEHGEAAHKLLLTQTDKDTLMAIVTRSSLPHESSVNIRNNFKFFEDRINPLNGNLSGLCKGLKKLTVVDVALHRGQDNPQLIFESMNYKGLDLSQADLIRNYILMGLDYESQTRLYKDHWRPMEVAFGQEAYVKHFDDFMRRYLTMKTGNIPNIGKVYEVFKEYTLNPTVPKGGIEGLVKDVQKFATYYCAMALGKEKDSMLAIAFADLRELKANVTHPLLLELYDDYAEKNLLTAEEFEQAVRLIESYVLRRAVCNIPTNTMNKTFASFGKELKVLGKGVQEFKHANYLICMELNFQSKSSRQRFPNDKEFHLGLMKADLYHGGRCKYILERLEKHCSGKEKVQVNEEITIEHIMPQTLTDEWKDDLGNGWEQVHKEMLQTLGNLTLTGYNFQYSNSTFPVKRDGKDGKDGLRHSNFWLNEGLESLASWNEEKIKDRAEYLADRAIGIWKRSSLPRTLASEGGMGRTVVKPIRHQQ